MATTLLSLSRARYPETTSHDIFTSLVEDMITTVFDHTGVESLVRLRSTGTTADLYISGYLSRRLAAHLRRFVRNPTHFLDELEICCSVISGSSALAVLFRLPWIPGDLDIYTPRDYFYHVVAYLVNVEEYTLSFLSQPHYASYGNVRNVARLLRDDGQRIDVIQSESNSALLPLASFWNTAVMNYISSSGFCVAYPRLTEAHRALLSTRSTFVPNDGGVPYPDVDTDVVVKYLDRGFDLRFTHMGWIREDDASAGCPGMGSSHCPLTIRYFGDRHCVTGSLGPVQAHKTSSLRCDLLQDYTVVWWRGGPTCGGACSEAGPWVYGNSYGCLRSLLAAS
ncbi:hypothetical protein VTO73DRAFT_7611 [Trametes versicolor]